MTNPAPLISVILPIYNTESYIESAIRSILNQTFSDFEIVAWDDASTDRSLARVQAIQDPRIRIFRNEKNQGLAATLNLAIAEARGEWLARMDGDDWSLPDRLERQLNLVRSWPDCAVLGGNIQEVNEGGGVLSPQRWRSKARVPREWDLFWETPIAHPTAFIRASVAKKLDGPYRLVAAEDHDFWTRMSAHGRIHRDAGVVLRYLVRQSGYYNQYREKHWLQSLKSSREMAERVFGRPMPPTFDALTEFGSALGMSWSPEVSVQEEWKWLSELLEKAARAWSWDREEIAAARADARFRVEMRLLRQKRIRKAASWALSDVGGFPWADLARKALLKWGRGAS